MTLNFGISVGTDNRKTSKKAWNDGEARNKYFVYVTNTENGEKTRFTFWDSLNNTQRGAVLDGDELLSAFYCFVSDALSGAESFSDFCGEFGYDEDSRNAERIYKDCKRSYESFVRVSGLPYDEICDFANELQEIAG